MTGSYDRWLELPRVGVGGPACSSMFWGPSTVDRSVRPHWLLSSRPHPSRSVLAASPLPPPHHTGRSGPPGAKSLPPRECPRFCRMKRCSCAPVCSGSGVSAPQFLPVMRRRRSDGRPRAYPGWGVPQSGALGRSSPPDGRREGRAGLPPLPSPPPRPRPPTLRWAAAATAEPRSQPCLPRLSSPFASRLQIPHAHRHILPPLSSQLRGCSWGLRLGLTAHTHLCPPVDKPATSPPLNSALCPTLGCLLSPPWQARLFHACGQWREPPH